MRVSGHYTTQVKPNTSQKSSTRALGICRNYTAYVTQHQGNSFVGDLMKTNPLNVRQVVYGVAREQMNGFRLQIFLS